MTRAQLDAPENDIALHDHAVCLFDDETDLGRAVTAFVARGAAKGELSVFVHSFASDEDAWRFIERAYGDRAPPARDIALVSMYTRAFQGARPHIDREHVSAVVASLVARARGSSRSGVRIFVDASRRYLEQSRADEWFDFEAWFGRRLQDRVGLVCAYRRADVMDPANIGRVLETHAYRFSA